MRESHCEVNRIFGDTSIADATPCKKVATRGRLGIRFAHTDRERILLFLDRNLIVDLGASRILLYDFFDSFLCLLGLYRAFEHDLRLHCDVFARERRVRVECLTNGHRRNDRRRSLVRARTTRRRQLLVGRQRRRYRCDSGGRISCVQYATRLNRVRRCAARR